MTMHTVAFVGIAAAIVISPGPHMMIVTRNALTGGRAAGLATAAGIATGTAVWAGLAAAGLAALVAASNEILVIVRWAGAGYLLWLGISFLVRPPVNWAPPDAAPARLAGWAGPFRVGVLSNLLHPGQVIFFSSLLPQFADAGADPASEMIRLSAVFVGVVLIWFSIYALVISRVRLTARGGVIAQRISALALIGFAVMLVLSR